MKSEKKRKDPICGMKEEKGKGIEKDGKWFCSDNCAKEHKKSSKQDKDDCCGCCH